MNVIPLKTFSELKIDEGNLSLLCVECNVPLTAEHYASHGYVTPRPMLVTPQAAAGRKGGLAVRIARGDECRDVREAGWATHRAWPTKTEKSVKPQRPMTAPAHRARPSPRASNLKKTSACSKKTNGKTDGPTGLSRKPRIESVTALLNSMRQQRAERPQPEEYKVHEQRIADRSSQAGKSKEHKWMDAAKARVLAHERQGKGYEGARPASSYQNYQSAFQTIDAEGKPKRLTASERLEASLRSSLNQTTPRRSSTPRGAPHIQATTAKAGTTDVETPAQKTSDDPSAVAKESMSLYHTAKMNTDDKRAAMEKSFRKADDIKPVPGPNESVLAAVEGARTFAFRGSENGRVHIIDDDSVSDDDPGESEESKKNGIAESEVEASEIMAARRTELSDQQKKSLKVLPFQSEIDHISRLEKIRAARETTAESVRRLREQREMKLPARGTESERKDSAKSDNGKSDDVQKEVNQDGAIVDNIPAQYIDVRMMDVHEVTTITSNGHEGLKRPQTARPSTRQPPAGAQADGSRTARIVPSEFEAPRAEYRKVLRPQSAGRTKPKPLGKSAGSKRIVRPKSAKGRLTHFTNYTSQHVNTSGAYAASTLAKVSKDDIDHRVRKYRKPSGKEEVPLNAKGLFGMGIAKYNEAKKGLEDAVTRWGLEVKDAQAAKLISKISGGGRPKVMKLDLDVNKIIQDKQDREERKKREEYQKWLESEEKQEHASWKSKTKAEEKQPKDAPISSTPKRENPHSHHVSKGKSMSIHFQKAGTKRTGSPAKSKEKESKRLSADERFEMALEDREYEVAPPYLSNPKEHVIKASNQYMPKPQIESSDPIEVSIFDYVDKSTMALVDYVKSEMDLWQTLGDTDFKIAECKQFVVREAARLEAEMQQTKRSSIKPQQQPQQGSKPGRAKSVSGVPHRYKKLLDMDKKCYFGVEAEKETPHLSMALNKWNG